MLILFKYNNELNGEYDDFIVYFVFSRVLSEPRSSGNFRNDRVIETNCDDADFFDKEILTPFSGSITLKAARSKLLPILKRFSPGFFRSVFWPK